MIYTLDNITKDNIHKIGGKAANLFYLTKNGFNVPEWFVIPTGTNPEQHLDEIRTAYNTLTTPDQQRVAVRSSAASEDSLAMSFAGQFHSVLNVKSFDELIQAIRAVHESAHTDRVTEYLTQHNKVERVEMSVIAQLMVEATISGVMFTEHPVTEDPHTILINAGNGTGGAVNGENVSSYTLEKKSGRVIHAHEEHSAPLSQIQLGTLHRTAQRIESLYPTPQDIEWAFIDETLYLLQSRPVTAPKKKRQELLWDSSNISESYSGFVAPLTTSFARRIYSVVYQEVALTSGVPKALVQANQHVFDNMLGFFHGRFYYNMHNWYRVLMFFPGFGFTKDALDRMISLRSSTDFNEPSQTGTWFKVTYTCRAIYRYFTFAREITTFTRVYNSVVKDIKQDELVHLSIDQLVHTYYSIEGKLLRAWHTPIDNDFLLMIFYGLVRKIVIKFGLEKHRPGIYNDLLSNIKGVASTEQSTALQNIVRAIRVEPDALKLFTQNTALTVWDDLKDAQINPGIYQSITEYLKKFGNRFASELKLEEPSITEAPEKLIALISAYLHAPENHTTYTSVREDAKKYVREKLSKPKQWILFWTIRQSEYFLKNREEARLMRSHMFGVVRSVFSGIGQRFREENILCQSEDIFYLEIDEVIRYIEGSSVHANLKPLVALHRSEAEQAQSHTPPDRFTTAGLPYRHMPPSNAHAYTDNTQDTHHTGLPCSSGQATGKVQVMQEFSYNINTDATILVAKHTDPGWTPIFSRFAGIVVEYGGQLSHAAIVARELGIPCVVGVKNITQILKNGDLISMDGSRGEIIIQT